MKNIQKRVLLAVKKIPHGKITTYKEIAIKLKTHPRAVAKILSKNTHPVKIPCHRVIRSDGSIGGYTYKGKSNPKMKIKLLKKEGLGIKDGKLLL